jgi:hypothetical protein
VPISVDPVTASQSQLTLAWVAAIGRNPVNLDGGTFWGPSTHKFYSYYTATNAWTAATMEIAGDLIATGTIRAASLISTDVYAINYQSTNATLGSTSSYGTWIKANDGEAYFASTVTIGANLFVDGLITAGSLKADTVRASNIVYQTITREKIAPGVLPSSAGTSFSTSTMTLSNSSTYDWYYSGSSIGYTGHYKTIAYNTIVVTDAMVGTSVYNKYTVTISFDLWGSGFLAYPSGPIFFLYANDNRYGGNTRFYVPVNGVPVPSGGSNLSGSLEGRPAYFSVGGITSYNGPIQLSTNFTLPYGTETLVAGETLTLGCALVNGANASSPLGVLTMTNIAWSVGLGA